MGSSPIQQPAQSNKTSWGQTEGSSQVTAARPGLAEDGVSYPGATQREPGLGYDPSSKQRIFDADGKMIGAPGGAPLQSKSRALPAFVIIGVALLLIAAGGLLYFMLRSKEKVVYDGAVAFKVMSFECSERDRGGLGRNAGAGSSPEAAGVRGGSCIMHVSITVDAQKRDPNVYVLDPALQELVDESGSRLRVLSVRVETISTGANPTEPNPQIEIEQDKVTEVLITWEYDPEGPRPVAAVLHSQSSSRGAKVAIDD